MTLAHVKIKALNTGPAAVGRGDLDQIHFCPNGHEGTVGAETHPAACGAATKLAYAGTHRSRHLIRHTAVHTVQIHKTMNGKGRLLGIIPGNAFLLHFGLYHHILINVFELFHRIPPKAAGFDRSWEFALLYREKSPGSSLPKWQHAAGPTCSPVSVLRCTNGSAEYFSWKRPA